MNSEEVKKIIEAYQKKLDRFGNDDDLIEIGNGLDEKSIKAYLDFAIQNDIQPDVVLRGILESIPDEKRNLTISTIKCSLQNIIKWKFSSPEKGDLFSTVLRKLIPQICAPKMISKMMEVIWEQAKKINPEKENYELIEEKLISIIPALFNKLFNENVKITSGEEEKSSKDICQDFINKIFEDQPPLSLLPYLADLFSEIPMKESDLERMIDYINSQSYFSDLPDIALKIFQPLRQSKKLTPKCMKSILNAAIRIDRDSRTSTRDTQTMEGKLIKNISLVASTSRPVLDSVTSILCSKTELNSHFTPFVVSLSLYLSRMRTKIYDSLYSNFEQQLKDEQMRTVSRYLRHVYNLFNEELHEIPIESVIIETVQLTHHSLESNIRFLIEFAFNLVDKAPQYDSSLKRLPSKIRESSSQFVTPAYRQVEIGVKILDQCTKVFPVECPEIFRQIVQRLLLKMPNCVSLIRCLNSPDNPHLAAEFLVDIIEQMQHIDLNTLEQVMRVAIPKIIDDQSLVDRVVMSARKSFCNRSESSKLNGLACMFYLIQPRAEQTFTQAFITNHITNNRLDSVCNEDLQFEIFSLIQRGFFQSPQVQADTAMFIPLLLQQNISLADNACNMFDQLISDVYKKDLEFPLDISRNLPYLLQSIADTLFILPNNVADQDNWQNLTENFNEITEKVSKVELVVYTEEMKILGKPEERDIICAVLAVLFNYSIRTNVTTALEIFNTYDRLNHKIAESERLRKDKELRSNYSFKFSLNIELLKTLYKLLKGDNTDITKHYGIQLYVLERTKEVINDVPILRLEYRMNRLKLALDLGEMTIDAMDKIEWLDAPSGMKNAQCLTEILTDNFKKLFVFVFETYDRKTVESFLEKSKLLTPGKGIESAQRNIFSNVKVFLEKNQTKCADNFCKILENLSLFDVNDPKLFESITKLMSKLIVRNTTQSFRIIRLARCFCPGARLDWLKMASDSIVERLLDEDGQTSAPLHEIIQCVSGLTGEVNWGLGTWISKVNSINAEKTYKIIDEFATFMTDLSGIGMKLMEVDYTRLQMKYYEEMLKFLRDYVKVINKFIKKIEELKVTEDNDFVELLKITTGKFGEMAGQFTFKSQQKSDPDKSAKQNEFDAKFAPQLIFEIEKMIVNTRKLIDKKLIEDISDDFCRLKNADVKIKRPSKKKQKKVEEDENEEQNKTEDENRTEDENKTEDEQNTEDHTEDDENKTDDDEKDDEDEEHEIQHGQKSRQEESESEDEDSIVDL